MSERDPIELTEDERDEFLGRGGTGVISLSSGMDEPPHAIPVSYGYDATEETFYFRLAVDEESEKGDLSGRQVTFVVYGQNDDWRSVVAKGSLRETTDDDIAATALSGLERTHIPLVDIFGRPPRQVVFEFYQLVPDSLTGRREVRTGL
jgi:nitroimidazol reductase NimA-like FMN-containing flavoprotein (pyridoxamine 5'-phosphate oxidase superfamily)